LQSQFRDRSSDLDELGQLYLADHSIDGLDVEAFGDPDVPNLIID
jgi:hypothetical protein